MVLRGLEDLGETEEISNEGDPVFGAPSSGIDGEFSSCCFDGKKENGLGTLGNEGVTLLFGAKAEGARSGELVF